ncbi:MAG TPA: HlyD family efflux transporter periplasmic adaptor subunit [Rhodanobacter sp.]|nr:HlyD family efflux transporter periplasmic adaptor subunit [Rhodanobacter sp.]
MTSRSQKLLVSPALAVVEEIVAPAGTVVEKGARIVQLASPQAVQELAQAKMGVQKGELDLQDALLTHRMDYISGMGKLRVADLDASLETHQRDVMKPLAESGIISKIEMLRQEAKLSTLELQAENQRSTIGLTRDLDLSKVKAKQDALIQAKLLLTQAQANVDALTVRAAIAGPVQEVFVSLGQSVAQGEKLAQVADAENLVASLNVPQSHASVLAIGAPATLSLMGRELSGHVIRVDPKVRDGAVLVDVAPDKALPPGVRVAQSVSGEIQTSSDADTIFLPKTASMSPYNRATVFVLREGGLVPQSVQFGAASATQIEVVSGLSGGEDVTAELPQALLTEKYIKVEK